jgi:hypothetical protein
MISLFITMALDFSSIEKCRIFIEQHKKEINDNCLKGKKDYCRIKYLYECHIEK